VFEKAAFGPPFFFAQYSGRTPTPGASSGAGSAERSPQRG